MTPIILGLVIAGLAAGQVAATEQSYGSADFTPSPERPLNFRGNGSGIYAGATPPVEFSATNNLRWVTKIPVVEKPGSWSHSPPVVVGKRVFISAEPDSTICLDADTGKILWRDALGKLEPVTDALAMYSGNGFSTACSDGAALYRQYVGRPTDKTQGKHRVYVVSYDLEGKRRWLVDMSDALAHRASTYEFTSPLLIGDRLIVWDRGQPCDLVALDTGTGKTIWKQGYKREPTDGNPWGAGTDGGMVPLRLGNRTLMLSPGGWCIDPSDGKLLTKALIAEDGKGRKYNRLGIELGVTWAACYTPVVRANPDGSATVIFAGRDNKAFTGENKQHRDAIPPETDLAQPPWSERDKKDILYGERILACRLSLDPAGAVRCEPLWSQPTTFPDFPGDFHPQIALAGSRIAFLHALADGMLGVVDLKTGRILGGGKDGRNRGMHRIFAGKDKRQFDVKEPKLAAAMAEYDLTEGAVFGRGEGASSCHLLREWRAPYPRMAVDSRHYLYLPNRMNEFFVLELTDEGYRELAKNVIDLPVCHFSHADPVLHGGRVYHRTWGHMWCFEKAQ